MHFVDQNGVLALIRLLLGCGEYGHPHLLGKLPDFKYWCPPLSLNHISDMHNFLSTHSSSSIIPSNFH